MPMYEVIYDYCDDYTEERNIHEVFECSWDKLIEVLAGMRDIGCFIIDVNAIEGSDD